VLAFMGFPLLSSITNLQVFIDKESVLTSRTMESIGLLFAVGYAIKHSCCRLYLWWLYPVRLYFFLVLLLFSAISGVISQSANLILSLCVASLVGVM
jgi:hypothetical protein